MKYILATALIMFGASANAATVVIGDDNNAVELLSFELRGVIYNVRFETGTVIEGEENGWHLPYDPYSLIEFNLQNEAVDLINADLAAAGVTSIGIYSSNEYVLPIVTFGPDRREFHSATGYYQPSDDRWIRSGGPRTSDTQYVFAAFTVVPLPATVWLLGSGLGLLGWLRHRHVA